MKRNKCISASAVVVGHITKAIDYIVYDNVIFSPKNYSTSDRVNKSSGFFFTLYGTVLFFSFSDL